MADLDDDGRPDIYVACDTTMNLLFHNLGGMKFEDVSLISGAGVNAAGRAFGGMGVNAGDLDGDGRIDLVVANFEAEPNSFFRNLGDGVFEDVSGSSGFGPPGFNSSGFGLNLLDAANAGRLDAFIANGHVLEVPRMQGVTYAERPLFLWNDGKGKFTERGCGAPFRRELVGRGSAIADFDNDGDLDIAVSNSGGPLELLRNDGTHGAWIGLVLRGRRSNRQGIGARVTLETDAGRQVREIRGRRQLPVLERSRACTSASGLRGRRASRSGGRRANGSVSRPPGPGCIRSWRSRKRGIERAPPQLNILAPPT